MMEFEVHSLSAPIFYLNLLPNFNNNILGADFIYLGTQAYELSSYYIVINHL